MKLQASMRLYYIREAFFISSKMKATNLSRRRSL